MAVTLLPPTDEKTGQQPHAKSYADGLIRILANRFIRCARARDNPILRGLIHIFGAFEHGRSGRLNFTLRMYLDPKEEFKQIFNEGWRNQRDYLYVPNMQGSDWPRMRELYGQMLPYVMHCG